jgi:hypothetical protein
LDRRLGGPQSRSGRSGEEDKERKDTDKCSNNKVKTTQKNDETTDKYFFKIL